MEASGFSSSCAQRESFTTEDIENILFSETYEDTFGQLGAKEVYHEILRLKRKELELHLHGVSLSDYYRERKIPRGFRINNTPTIGRTNPEFCKRWCNILDRCSLDLILLVVEEVGRELRSIKSELNTFEAANTTILLSDKDTDWPGKLDIQIAKYKAELLAFKNSKRLKVQQDYKEGTIYRWQQGGALGPRRRRADWRMRRPAYRRDGSGTGSKTSDSGSGRSRSGSPQDRTPQPAAPSSSPFLGEHTQGPSEGPPRHSSAGKPPAGA
ncbi:hypothetical protein XELAEV_18014806mg [Xenopus laevis]|uniref:Uncharacterized protein n=1 Tax=Xenopus laevis TaxID=8355 RepID=A0A974HVR9_XENLA|nr:hypothetical protein XELAEV_18014806mg [Xenopus laevis]